MSTRRQESGASRSSRLGLSLRALMFAVLFAGTWLGLYLRSSRPQYDPVAEIERRGGTVGWTNGKQGEPRPVAVSYWGAWDRDGVLEHVGRLHRLEILHFSG